jgi:hypothetical protein
VDVIVIGFGIWETAQPRECIVPNKTISELQEEVLESIHEFLQVRPDVKIIWRTTGWYGDSRYSTINNETQIMRDAMMDKLDEHLSTSMNHSNLEAAQFSYVNWGDAIAERAFDAQRISGDTEAHYGTEPRMVLVQMINNRFSEMLQYQE